MRIGIDFHAAEREGTGNCTYIRNVVENLIKLDNKNEYFLYITDINYKYYDIFKNYNQVYLKPINFHSPFVRMLLTGVRSFIDKIDVLHATYYGPPLYHGKLILLIHDLSYLYVPESFSRFDRMKDVILIPTYAKRAKKVITVSEYSRRDIINQYKVGPEHVVVGYNGVNPIFRPVQDEKYLLSVKERYNISDKFILFVGRLNKRKNLTGLIRAFNILKEKMAISHDLVIVGSKDYLPTEDETIINSSPYQNNIIFIGYVPAKDLPILYNLADVFVYPSFYEGFGLPCAEAMACGCPVVCSNSTSIPEVVGDAGILIDPQNIEEIVAAIFNVISNSSLRSEMIGKGLEQAKKFNWENTAKKTLEVIMNIDKAS